MKFYIAHNDSGEVLDAFTTLRMAKEAVRASESPGYVDMVDIDVNSESVRLLLSDRGGYAKECRQVWRAKF